MSLRPEIQRLVEAARRLVHVERMHGEERMSDEEIELWKALAACDASESERSKWPEVRVVVAVTNREGFIPPLAVVPLSRESDSEAVSNLLSDWSDDCTVTHVALFKLRVPPFIVPVEEE